MTTPGIITRTWLRNPYGEFVYETPAGFLRRGAGVVPTSPQAFWRALLDQRREHLARGIPYAFGQVVLTMEKSDGPAR